MSLSGGALGISFAFVKDFTPLETAVYISLLVGSWVVWGFSLAAVLLSHFFSVLALRSQISSEDSNREEKKSNRFDAITSILNISSGALFLLGVLLLSGFVYINLGKSHVQNEETTAVKSQTVETTSDARSSSATEATTSTTN